MPVHIDTPVQYLKGVGPKLGDILRKRGFSTVGELLEWYPRTYEDQRAARSICTLEVQQTVSLVARVLSVKTISLGRSRRKMYEVNLTDKTGQISCRYFRMPYKGYFERFKTHEQVRVSGKVTSYRGRLELHHPDLHVYREDEEMTDALIPLYTEIEGLRAIKLRKIIGTAIHELIIEPKKPKKLYESSDWVDDRTFGLPDYFPQWVIDKYKLMPRGEALKAVHQPSEKAGDEFLNFKTPAQQRIIFEEFFWLELHLAYSRAGIKKEKALPMKQRGSLVDEFKTNLPFQLTRAQLKAFEDIKKDLAEPHPMHRLVQGDVGCGKTVVALMAAALAKNNFRQSAIMAPTEILAEQHYKNAKKMLEPLGITVGLLTGQLKTKEKQAMIEALRADKIDLCVGTHALIQSEVEFNDLGLVIIDEQHRFGVDQRSQLKHKGLSPHFLVMTATPIPRTLAMTVYGDLDVSVINEMPKGRLPVMTRKVFESKRSKVMFFLKQQIEQGRQAYIVYPLVEESDKVDLKDALSQYEKLKEMFPQYKFGLLHGKMKPSEKEESMNKFRKGDIQILVSTTVIEVGVDVANANLMIIEHAERFGLSQLHQLRGRVGRGKYKSYCILMLGYALSEESRYRAEIMEKTTDGFKIAEADLELRGPGEFIGKKQSGLSSFKMAHLVRDIEILQSARNAAFEVVKKDPGLNWPEHSALKLKMQKNRTHWVG